MLDGKGGNKNKRIHRLVAETFIDNPMHYPEINHKDENKKNNNVMNLEWCTSSYNKRYGKGSISRANTMRMIWEIRHQEMGLTSEQLKAAQRERSEEKRKEIYFQNKAKGICVKCKKASAIPGRTHCEVCAEQNRLKAKRIREARRS